MKIDLTQMTTLTLKSEANFSSQRRKSIGQINHRLKISTKHYFVGLIIVSIVGFVFYLNFSNFYDQEKSFDRFVNDSIEIGQCSLTNIDKCQQISSRTLVFRLADSAGFTSEINNLIRAFYYAIRTRRKFIIDDQCWNYGRFSSWFDDSKGNFLSKFPLTTNCRYRTILRFIQNEKNDRKTSKHLIVSRDFNGGFSTLNNLMEPFENHSKILEHKRLLARYLWTKLNNETKSLMKNYTNEIENIDYGIHIRRGDKLNKEAQLISSREYIDAIEYLMKNETKSNRKPRIFVASDEFDMIDELRRIRPNWNFTQLSILNDVHEFISFGHSQIKFNRLPLKKRLEFTRILIVEIEILSRIKYVVCTFSSNVCRFIQILRTQAPETILSLDQDWYPQ